MMNEICNLFKNKKILILGFGREGKSTYKLIRKFLPDKVVGIYDQNPIKDSLQNVILHGGPSFHEILPEYDLIIKSPGIVIDNVDLTQINKFTSQTDLFLDLYRQQTIGITGTKGKSTTSSLLYHILHTSGKDTLLVGNIGLPVFDALEKINPETIIVFELSSHQLEYVTHSPHIGVLLNIYQEHLDHYGTFEKYKIAKENIYQFQKQGDILIYNKEFFELPKEFAADTITISNTSEDADAVVDDSTITYLGKTITIEEDELSLKGAHNVYNTGAAYVLAKTCGITDEQFLEAIKTFKSLPHRMEYVAEVEGVKYYNDSISTICETTIQAVNSLKGVDTVILGGMDRGIDYEPLVEFLLESSVHNIILMPDTGYRIQKLIEESGRQRNDQNIVIVRNVEEAVTQAKKITLKRKTCLFSPAAASYGFFKNFEERGDLFKKLVLNENKAG